MICTCGVVFKRVFDPNLSAKCLELEFRIFFFENFIWEIYFLTFVFFFSSQSETRQFGKTQAENSQNRQNGQIIM
jgi:hypothetical protein